MDLQVLAVNQPRLEVALSGRTYPVSEAASTTRIPNPAQAEIFSRLWSRFALPDEKPESLDGVVHVYDSDRQQLSGWRSEMRRLLDALATASFELRATEGSAPTETERILAARKETAREKFAFPPSGLDKTLSAELLLTPPSAVHGALVRELRTQLKQFADHVFATLDRLVDDKAVGLIEWLSDSLCRFHFFRDVVVHNSETSNLDEVRAVITDKTSGRLMTQVSEIRNQAGTNVYRLARHEHDLMNAVRESIDETTLIIPRAIEAVIAEIPDWLLDMSGIISGDCVRERIIERDLRTDAWESTEQEVVRVYFDPAVTVGDYVLIGWGEADIHREKQTQLRELDAAQVIAKLARTKQEKLTAGISGAVLLSLAATVAFFGAVTTPWIYLAAGSLGILGLFCLGYGLCQWQASLGRAPNLKVTSTLLAIAGCVTLTVAGGGVALLSPSIWAWGITAAALGLTVCAWRSLDVRF